MEIFRGKRGTWNGEEGYFREEYELEQSIKKNGNEGS